MRESERWHSERLGKSVEVIRWGTYGTPVLLFPTAGGDADEPERFLMIKALQPLIEAKRIKVYSVDSVAGQAWLSGKLSPRQCSRLQNLYDAFVEDEVVPLIHSDSGGPSVGIVAAGAAIGAFNAVASLCRHPDLFSIAIGMSGTYDLERWLHGHFNHDFYYSSPMHFLPNLNAGPHLKSLQRRLVVLATGEGRWEEPSQSWKLAQILGAKGIPNRVDPWGEDWDHDWNTWRRMLPKYLDELAEQGAQVV